MKYKPDIFFLSLQNISQLRTLCSKDIKIMLSMLANNAFPNDIFYKTILETELK